MKRKKTPNWSETSYEFRFVGWVAISIYETLVGWDGFGIYLRDESTFMPYVSHLNHPSSFEKHKFTSNFLNPQKHIDHIMTIFELASVPNLTSHFTII